MFDIKARRFKKMASLNIDRKEHSSTAYGHRVFVIGGVRGYDSTESNSIEMLDLDKSHQQWEIIAQGELYARNHCVFSVLPNSSTLLIAGGLKGYN